MAIVLTQSGALFVHIPKTGGTWVANVLNRLGIANESAPHVPAASVRHAIPEQFVGRYKFRFTFVRHPLAWYESWWKFQAGVWRQFEVGVWHPQRVLEPCADNDFSQFIRNCLVQEPGYVTRMYEWYLGPPEVERFDFVGRTESLAEDLVTVLRQLGHTNRIDEVSHFAPVHVSRSKFGEAVWDPELRRRIIDVEAPAIRRFYADFDESPHVSTETIKRGA